MATRKELTDERVIELIKNIPYNQFEWDSAILAKHLRPILLKLAQGGSTSDVSKEIGELDDLTTQNKSDIVSAINEIMKQMEDLQVGDIGTIQEEEIDNLLSSII